MVFYLCQLPTALDILKLQLSNQFIINGFKWLHASDIRFFAWVSPENKRNSKILISSAAFYWNEVDAKAKLEEGVKKCRLHNGFFQIIGHNVPELLQMQIFQCAKRFFDQPLEEKNKVNRGMGSRWLRLLNRCSRYHAVRHSRLLSFLKVLQEENLTADQLSRSEYMESGLRNAPVPGAWSGSEPELKEGFLYWGIVDSNAPYFLQKKLNSGPNIWPETLEGIDDFKNTTLEYYTAVCKLATDVLAVLALGLDLAENYFDGFASGAVATMRLLHCPPQPADSNEKLSRGIGAHTDFGAVTLLMQEEVDGLQVWNEDMAGCEWGTQTKNFHWYQKVEPTKGAYVINLGNMFMRWEVFLISSF